MLAKNERMVGVLELAGPPENLLADRYKQTSPSVLYIVKV